MTVGDRANVGGIGINGSAEGDETDSLGTFYEVCETDTEVCCDSFYGFVERWSFRASNESTSSFNEFDSFRYFFGSSDFSYASYAIVASFFDDNYGFSY